MMACGFAGLPMSSSVIAFTPTLAASNMYLGVIVARSTFQL